MQAFNYHILAAETNTRSF